MVSGAVTRREFRLKRSEDRLMATIGRFKTLPARGGREQLTLAGDGVEDRYRHLAPKPPK
jgi:hypothetical protein